MAENRENEEILPEELEGDAEEGVVEEVVEAVPEGAPYGEVYLAWEVPEYRKYQRGRAWYAVAGVVGLGLLIYAVASANFVFALIVIMFALVLYMNAVGEQHVATFAIADTGILLGDAYFPYKDVRRFWVVYEPPAVQSLYVELKSGFRSRLTVALDGQNPNQVRQTLAAFVREDLDEDGEPLSDMIGRILKI